MENTDFIIKALDEDIGSGDHTSLATIDADDLSKARLIVKDRGVIAGVSFAKAVFEIEGLTTKVNAIESKLYPTPAERPFYSVLNCS